MPFHCVGEDLSREEYGWDLSCEADRGTSGY